jgi:hypothetical protein
MRKRGKDSLGLNRVVTARGRRMVGDFMAALAPGESFLANLSTAAEHLRWSHNDLVPAFVEVMVDGKPSEQVMAAWMLLNVQQNASKLLPPKAVKECQTVLVRSLKDEDNQLLACVLLAQGPILSCTIPPLRKLVHHPDARISVPSAAALIQADLGGDVDPDIGAAFRVLRKTLTGKIPILAGIAGCALIRFGLWDKESARDICVALPEIADESQYSMLQTIRLLGLKAKSLFDVTAAILSNTTNHEVVREAAAEALGSLTAGSDEATPLLQNALRSDNWHVVNGALCGLSAAGHLPDATLDRLIELLDHDDEHMRVTAAMGVGLMHKRAAAAIPFLIRRLGEEQSLDIAGEMATALSAIGEAAVPSLIAVILEGDGLRCEYAMQALVAIGSHAARTLAELFCKTDNVRIQKMLLGTLVGMGRRAMPAVPVMADILDETDNDELAIFVAMGIAACGPSAVAAIDALLRCIAIRGCDDPVGMWAERALWAMRETAIPELENAVKETSGTHRQNLERALAGMDASFGSDLGRLLHYDRDDLFALFVDIGTVIEKQGPTSWRTMSEVLSEKQEHGLLTPGYKGVSQRFIGTRMQTLERLLGARVTTHGGNQKGELTPEGCALLKEAREYLLKKSLQRRRYAKQSR